MKIQLHKTMTDVLLKSPETGMGYQKVDVVLRSENKHYFINGAIALNGDVLVIPEKFSSLRGIEVVGIKVVERENGTENNA